MKSHPKHCMMARIVTLPAVYVIVMSMVGALLLPSCRGHVHGGGVKDAHYEHVDSLLRDVHSVDSLAVLIRQYHDNHDVMGELLGYEYLGRVFRRQSHYEEAIKIHNLELELATSLNDTLEMTSALNQLATDYLRISKLSIANGYFYKALALCDAYGHSASPEAVRRHIVTLNGIGNIELQLCNYRTADSVFHKALSGEMSLGNQEGIAVNHANIGGVKRALGQTDSAWHFYREALKYYQLSGEEGGVAECHHHFGELYVDERNYSHALEEYQLAYKSLKEHGESWQWIKTGISLASIYLLLGEEDEARRYLSEAESEAVRINNLEYQAEVYRLHYELSLLEGNTQSALTYFAQSEEMYDSIYGREKSDEMRSQRVNYQMNRSSGVVDLLNKDITRLKRLRNMQSVLLVLLLLMAAAIIAALVYAMRVRARSQRHMRQLEETRSLFFTNVVHQLRTPLSAIMGATDRIVADNCDYTPAQREKVEIVERQCRNLLVLVDRILEVGSVRSEINKLEWLRGDVVPYIRMILESYREACVERHIELTYASRELSAEIETVPDYLRTIVGSLIDNAMNYCHEYCKITVTTQVEDGVFIIRVADDGMGISKEDLPHVFEPFYRSADAEQMVDGVGIGLTVVRDMTMAMGGSVAVDSMKDRGSVFTVKLPSKGGKDVKQRFDDLIASSIPLVSIARKKEEPDVLDEGCAKDKPVVLIVEDHSDVAQLVGKVLKKDFNVHYAYNGEQGLARALELKPAVVITDVKMPQMDGYEMCRKIRVSSQLYNTAILMLSARTGCMDRVKGIEAGADVYLEKPFVGMELLAWVNHLAKRDQVKPHVERFDEGDSSMSALDDKTFMYRFAQLVDEQLTNGETKPDIDRIAFTLKMGEIQLKRRVQSITGKSVIAFISQLRMEKAMRLLKKHPDMLIGDVAQQCGFVDVAYFSRVFRQYYGMTPTQARNGQ